MRKQEYPKTKDGSTVLFGVIVNGRIVRRRKHYCTALLDCEKAKKKGLDPIIHLVQVKLSTEFNMDNAVLEKL